MPNTNRGNTTPTGPLVRTAHPNNKGMNMGSPFSSNLSSHIHIHPSRHGRPMYLYAGDQ